ncbi:aspartate/glutamate racemase family protein [Pokkaliibacter sp. CJK22405]|uniref:aspartate/glutamate racemase family protein n=1 Tax=Pokkaliibacter sp. CJK22405 TaxID=3384615 RepID=UPI0039852C67
MRTLGILGGMSWESTQVYYQDLNAGVRHARGGLSSAPLLLHSLEFSQLAAWQHAGDWEAIAQTLAAAAQGLEQAGAKAIMIATNTMHKVADQVQARIDVPLLHILEGVGQRLAQAGITQAGLLGTLFSMEDGFYQRHLAQGFDIALQVPEASGRQQVHRIIFEELCQGKVLELSRQQLADEAQKLAQSGCQAVILGCTELGLALQGEVAGTPLLDSTEIHIQQGLDFLLAQ